MNRVAVSSLGGFSREVFAYILHISENTLIQDFGVSLCHFNNTFAGTTIIAIFAPT